jgi:guanosine-3',5'-bis(diphosphate) 3'-pyrophosphohydrolase
MTLSEKAFCIALKAHDGQFRKTDTTPYIAHPVMVAETLARAGFPDLVTAAALVHDVIEDTSVTREELLAALGEEVIAIVDAVTEDKSLPWEARKSAYIEQVRGAGAEAKAVSLADKIHNIESMLDAYGREGEAVWAHFNRTKDTKLWFENRMLAMLEESWDHPLIARYRTLVERANAL